MRLLAIVIRSLLALLLAGYIFGPRAEEVTPVTSEPAAEGPKVTSSGFECPEPNPRMEVTSEELKLFVWTEYFPQDMLDCFELVSDIKLNRDEYSSNEEMYAKLVFYAAGIVLAHALQAAGATVYVMIVEVLTHWVILLPISYYLGVGLEGGLIGAWLALPAYILTYTALMIWKYRSGSWTHIRV